MTIEVKVKYDVTRDNIFKAVISEFGFGADFVPCADAIARNLYFEGGRSLNRDEIFYKKDIWDRDISEVIVASNSFEFVRGIFENVVWHRELLLKGSEHKEEILRTMLKGVKGVSETDFIELDHAMYNYNLSLMKRILDSKSDIFCNGSYLVKTLSDVRSVCPALDLESAAYKASLKASEKLNSDVSPLAQHSRLSFEQRVDVCGARNGATKEEVKAFKNALLSLEDELFPIQN